KSITNISDAMPPIHQKRSLVIRDRMKKFHPDDYHELKNSLNGPISKLVDKISELKQQIYDDYEFYQNSGSLDTNSLVRFSSFDETDVLKIENVEEENMKMDVMILVDCSGSNGSGILNKKTNVSL